MEPYDRNIPYNQLPDLPPGKEAYVSTEIYEALVKASRSLACLKGLAATLPNQSIFVNTIALREAKASSAIENIFTTDDELYRSLSYQDDDYLDGYDDVEEEVVKPSKRVRSNDEEKKINKVTSIASKKRASNSSNLEIYCLKPTSIDDAKEVADTLLENKAVILNLNNIDVDLARRVLDFSVGSAYALRGTLQKITDSIYVIVPEGVDISGAFVDGISQ